MSRRTPTVLTCLHKGIKYSTFDGVHSVYCNNKIFTTKVDGERKQLVITEFVPGDHISYVSDISSVCHVTLPDELCEERIIGQPVCIGCQDRLLLFQYLTSSKRYLRFFALDLEAEKISTFEDSDQFFNKDLFVVSPVECLISPSRQICLLRLPQTVMTVRKWSKLMQLRTLELNSPITPKNEILGTVPSKLRDRRHHMIAFHPHSEGRLVTALVDEFCSKCKFLVYDMPTSKVLMEKTHRLGERSLTVSEFDSDDSEGEDSTYYILHQCGLSFCRSGELLTIHCTGIDSRQNAFARILFYDSDTLKGITSKLVILTTIQLPFSNSDVFSQIYSVCDSELHLWHLKRGKRPISCVLSVTLPKITCLKALGRAAVLRNVAPKYVLDLPLPGALLRYLQYDKPSTVPAQ